MENRFFDIDTNKYLNCMYILAMLTNIDEKISIKKLLMSLYLIRNPKICMKFIKKSNQRYFLRYVESFELDNIQTDFNKYSSIIFNEGFNDALLLLISKGVVTYDMDSINIVKASEFTKLKLKMIPKALLKKSKYVNQVVEKYSESELEIKLLNYGEESYE